MYQYYISSTGDILLSINNSDLCKLIHQISAEIALTFGNPSYKYYIDPVKYADENDFRYMQNKSIPFEEDRSLNYAPHGYFNLVLSKVHFIYHFSKMVFEQKTNMDFYINGHCMKMLCKALNIFTTWKHLHRRAEVNIHGENWGSATGFVNWVPNEFSKELLKGD
jgi:hypothetical protein